MPVARTPKSPEICYPGACSGVETWGGGGAIYFKPSVGKDFMVILFNQRSDAVRVAAFEARSGLGSQRHGAVLLVYYKLTARIAKLRAALAALG